VRINLLVGDVKRANILGFVGELMLNPRFSHGVQTNTLNIETLIATAVSRHTQIEGPRLDIQDNIFFVINNISATNLEAKLKEFLDVLHESYYPWFSQYMVMKRVLFERSFKFNSLRSLFPTLFA
jgi:hypothetical protein